MSTNAERLGKAVRERRAELELNQVEVHQVGGPSNTWQTLIENDRLEKLSRVTARKIDAGMQWESGSARRVWNGTGEAVPVLPGRSSKDSAWLREQIGAARLDEATRARLLEALDEERGTA
jgi:hypothetical protein